MIPLLLVSALALAAAGQGAEHDHSPNLGKVSFESTCNPAAQGLFERGLGWLHSFEYQRAEKSFTEAAAADPACGIAHWGAAMSFYHPLWAAPTPAELGQGQAALARGLLAGARSQRERDYLAAIGAFYGEATAVDHKTRALDFSAAMEELHRRYPADREAAVFYALTLIATGTLDDDPNYTREKKASAILNAVLKEEPEHPGVAHYLIHSFDYPALAALALPAAHRYATIAPDSAHAQHMPSHIFTRLGLWDESIQSNLAAKRAAQDYAKSTGMSGAWDQQLHAMDYLTYAYLQTGRDFDANQLLAELQVVSRATPTPTTAYAVTSIPARVLLEGRQWAKAATFDLSPTLSRLEALSKHTWAAANLRFANAVGAARSGNAKLAREHVTKLGAIEAAITIRPGDYDWRTQVAISRQVAEAWLAQADGKPAEARARMRSAADLDDATEKHPVTPGAILPAREQLGELLLEQGRHAEALTEFEGSLRRAPRRFAGVYGAAGAAKLAGKQEQARQHYAALLELAGTSESRRAELQEAKAFVGAWSKTAR